MSRGGRGGFGARNTGGMMGGQKLPFDIDPELDIYSYGEDGEKREDPMQALFPPYPGGVPIAPPPTAAEKKLVSLYREMMAEKHASPSYTGPKGSLKALCGKRTAAEYNPFEDQQTYGKKYERKPFRLADPKKRKWQAPQFFPKELWEHIGYDPDAGEDQGPRKKIVLNKSAHLDKLAKFDEDAEERGVNGDADDAENEERIDEDAEADLEAPRDDDFEEDEDDDANDYNAEQYFDAGEDEDYDGGGDEYGGGGEDGY